ncbi:D-alanyl-D-alanine carboxypeptidase family protein [Shouchella shacheensis]|uniref:D-alanyl-D-alanine carboxypeptidase family protein n=1 Tax=Shouchella shacheensis TaxID=1649580 RepID=UPI000AE3B705|nr:D-alanyl-D-alanine carboxypeptidase family protein [Shouchella shacheensis]
MKHKISIMLLLFLMIFSSHSSSLASSEDQPNLMSEAAILIDANSGKVIFGKNAKRQMYPASITKMVTGILAIEEGDLTDIVRVSKEATKVDGTRVYLLEEEEVKLKRLVQGLLVNSGNDAGTAIAEHLADSESAFATKMNNFVKEEVGVTDSNFTNPHGLYDENHYTTAYDMAKIAQYAIENESFKKIVGTKELEWNGEGWETTLYNHHRLLWDYEGVTGIKNGYVLQSGFTLATSAEREGVELIAVTLNAPSSQDAYRDTTKLLDYGFGNFSTEEFSAGQTFEDNEGNQYQLESQTYVTVPKNSTTTTNIFDDALVIRNEDGTVIFEEELSPVNDFEKPLKERVEDFVALDDKVEPWPPNLGIRNWINQEVNK